MLDSKLEKWIPWASIVMYGGTGLLVVLSISKLMFDGGTTTSSESPIVSPTRPTPLEPKQSFDWGRQLQYGFRSAAKSMPMEPSNPMDADSVPILPPSPPLPVARDLGVKLIGTMIETNRSTAIVMDAIGNLDFCREGDSLSLDPTGILISQISESTVEVKFEGATHKWEMGKNLTIGNTNNMTAPAPRNQPPVKPLHQPDAPTPVDLEKELERINGSQ